MKIAIGLISAIFGMLLVIYGIEANFTNIVVGIVNKSWGGMGMGVPVGLAILVGGILIVVGCVVYERGVEEK